MTLATGVVVGLLGLCYLNQVILTVLVLRKPHTLARGTKAPSERNQKAKNTK